MKHSLHTLLDALVAEKVMRCKTRLSVNYEPEGHHCGCPGRPHEQLEMMPDAIDYSPLGIKGYSTDIAAAWEIVSHFVTKQVAVRLFYDDVAKDWRCEIDGWEAIADTSEASICLAALKAVGALEDK